MRLEIDTVEQTVEVIGTTTVTQLLDTIEKMRKVYSNFHKWKFVGVELEDNNPWTITTGGAFPISTTTFTNGCTCGKSNCECYKTTHQ